MTKLFNDISKQISKDARQAATMSMQRMLIKLQEEVADYETSEPRYYKHTYMLLNSPSTDGISGGMKNPNFCVYMDEDITYNTGKYNGAQVINATEEGHSKTIGNHGYFKRFEQQVPSILDECFGAFFIVR